MMQGDQYEIPVIIETDSSVANGDSFDDVEVSIGRIIKRMSNGDIRYDSGQKAFMVSVSQFDTFRLSSGEKSVQIRVKLKNGSVIGVSTDDVDVEYSNSKAVL